MSGDDDSEDVGENVEKAVEGVGKLAEGIANALPEDGEAGEAREALETVGDVAEGAAGAVEAARGVGSLANADDASGALGSLGSAGQGAGSLVGAVAGSEAGGVVSGVAAGVAAVGQAVEVFESLEEALGGGGGHGSEAEARHEVEHHFEMPSVEGRWGVREVDFHEALNEPYELTVRAFLLDAHPEASELLGQECSLSLEREGHQRQFKGVVRKAKVIERQSGVSVRLTIVPALAMLEQRRGSRIYQNLTVPQIVEELYQRALGGRSRELRNDLTETYPSHEYITQYQESELAFLTRLCEQEGIFFFFDHESSDHEVLVLADDTSGLAEVGEDGQIPFATSPDQTPGGEVVYQAHHTERVGTTDMVVADWDWTRPSVPVRDEQVGRSDLEPALEDYDHIDAVAIYDYSGTAYGANDATRQAQIRAERLDLDRQRWHMRSTVLTARPGRVIQLNGCPDGALDGRRYVIVSTHGSGEATEGQGGSYDNGFDCVPLDLPFRPKRRVPSPIAHGPSSAIVVGPSGEEIHTDEHGRIKVQFHWDREGQRDERSSCWLRVQQTWSGPGWGSWFLPRIGMEVVVQFMDGNPDKPFVAGCLYHGENPAPYPLPDEKTKSTIKTNSSPGGGGFNELRFEDKAGSEEIFTHAQKDYNEVVENNHSTTVHNNQTNSVDVNQTETVGADQTMTVHGERKKTVDKDETNTVHQNRVTRVDVNDTESVGGDRELTVTGDETVTIEKNRNLHVLLQTLQAHDKGREVTVKNGDKLAVADGANRSVEVTGEYKNKIDGKYVVQQAGTETLYLDGHIHISSAAKIELVAPDCSIKMEDGKIAIVAGKEITLQSGQSTVTLKTDGTIEAAGATKVGVEGGGAMGEWTATGFKATGNMVEIGADAVAKLTGTLVKIN